MSKVNVRFLSGRAVAAALLLSSLPASLGRAEEGAPSGPSTATRLKYVQHVLNSMKIDSTIDGKEDSRELKFQMKPLLRYNDPDRRIADSLIFRLGTKGRPIAIVTAELYNGSGRNFLLNHEFLAIDAPRIRLRRDVFRWEPPNEAALQFQPLESDLVPGKNPRARLAQFKQFAGKFSIREEWAGVQTDLRLLPTPIDRYQPSDKPDADAAIFAFVTGVNPEALLLLETDGKKWSFACARVSAAALEAKYDERTVWGIGIARDHEHPTASYTSIHRSASIPVELDVEDEAESEK